MSFLLFLSQLLSYSILTWAGFLIITFAGTRYGKLPGLIAGQVLIAFIVCYQDGEWMSAQLDGPGLPSDGPGFELGCLARIILINTVLLPLAWWAFRLRNRGKNAPVS
jgi:hypothetical protein